MKNMDRDESRGIVDGKVVGKRGGHSNFNKNNNSVLVFPI